METVPVRQLQQHASKLLRRVRAGESLAITDRGVVVAVLAPPTQLGGCAAVLAAGRARPATRRAALSPPTLRISRESGAVLDELRSDR